MWRKIAFSMGVVFLVGILALSSRTSLVKAEVTGVFPGRTHGFVDPLMDYYTVVGVLMNNGSGYATNIEVTCVFRDSQGQLVTTEVETIYRGGWLSLDYQYLPPEWTTPFEVQVDSSELSAQVASYEISVAYTWQTELPKANTLAIVEISLRLDYRNDLFGYDKWIVSGIIKNLASVNSTETRVKAIFLDSGGFPVGFGGDSISDTQPETIMAGEEGYFTLETLVPIYTDISYVELMIESDEAFGHYLNMPYTSEFTVDWNLETFQIQIFSNSTVGNPTLNQTAKQLNFVVAGENGTIGVSNITIPKQLLNCDNPTDWVITIDGAPVTYEMTETETGTSLYFTYQHSEKMVKIQGTHVIPEFPSTITLPLFMIVTLLAAIAYRRHKLKHQLQ